MREVERNEHVVVLELRGGTHLVLVPGTPATGDAPFDLMVDDLDATHTSVERSRASTSATSSGAASTTRSPPPIPTVTS